jgi:hypothetical protein
METAPIMIASIATCEAGVKRAVREPLESRQRPVTDPLETRHRPVGEPQRRVL